MKTILIGLLLGLSFNVFAVELTVKIKNINSSRGNIKVALFKGAKGFPGNNDAAVRAEIVDIVDGKAQITFRGLLEGDYAVSLFHDVNNNFRLDTRFRIPTEPLGFSNNPRLFGKPKYSSCKIDISADKTIEVYLKNLL